jgi:hypothetical protein
VTLYRWSVKNDRWEYETECLADNTRQVLRNVKRRSPTGTVFKWTVGPPPARRYGGKKGVRQ